MSNYTALGVDLGVPENEGITIDDVVVVAKARNHEGDAVYSVFSNGLHDVELHNLAGFLHRFSCARLDDLIHQSL